MPWVFLGGAIVCVGLAAMSFIMDRRSLEQDRRSLEQEISRGKAAYSVLATDADMTKRKLEAEETLLRQLRRFIARREEEGTTQR